MKRHPKKIMSLIVPLAKKKDLLWEGLFSEENVSFLRVEGTYQKFKPQRFYLFIFYRNEGFLGERGEGGTANSQ